MSNHTFRDLLKDWLDVTQRYEKGMISKNASLSAHTTVAIQASHIKPTTTEEACAQLLLVALMWKEENGEFTFPFHKAMDEMLGHVTDFMQDIKRQKEILELKKSLMKLC